MIKILMLIMLLSKYLLLKAPPVSPLILLLEEPSINLSMEPSCGESKSFRESFSASCSVRSCWVAVWKIKIGWSLQWGWNSTSRCLLRLDCVSVSWRCTRNRVTSRLNCTNRWQRRETMSTDYDCQSVISISYLIFLFEYQKTLLSLDPFILLQTCFHLFVYFNIFFANVLVK